LAIGRFVHVSRTKHLKNFGRNLDIHPDAYYEPRDEREVLEILQRHRGESLRAIGSLHSWSDAPACTGVALNLKHFQQVDVEHDQQTGWAIVGAGCQIKTLLKRLKQYGMTLPSVGLITEQTIAGAISTGTHGSGRHSLSHYVDAVRVARYDPITGTPIIEQIESGDSLRAARCSVGCLGIILSVRIRCRRQYHIEEFQQEYPTLDQVLAAENEFPLQQFFLVPWKWNYLAQHRRETSGARSRLASVYRVYWFLCIDIALKLLILFAVRLVGSSGFVRFLYRHVLPRTVIQRWKVSDESSAMLVMEQELFCHFETELFVQGRELPQALDYVRRVLVVASGSSDSNSTATNDEGNLTDEDVQVKALRGQYCHHFPICVRRVLGDDTLISMASGVDQVWYAISLITYSRPNDRKGFQQVVKFLTETMAAKFGARPHWGKWCPISPSQLVSLYPRFDDFRAVCVSSDPNGAFRNDWMNSLFSDRTG
jgi:FAD/FMN-containing dehydrogenase